MRMHSVALAKVARKRAQQRWTALVARIGKEVRPALGCMLCGTTSWPTPRGKALNRWDIRVDSGLLCHLLLGVRADPVHGAAMLCASAAARRPATS